VWIAAGVRRGTAVGRRAASAAGNGVGVEVATAVEVGTAVECNELVTAVVISSA
jgi:hypothetical protein